MSIKISLKKKGLVFLKNDSKCVMCGVSLQVDNNLESNYLQIDHLIPKQKGGSNSIDNLFPICRSCNCSKNNSNTNDVSKQLPLNMEKVNIKRIVNIYNYKNRFNPSSIDKVQLKNDCEKALSILNSKIQEIKDLINEI